MRSIWFTQLRPGADRQLGGSHPHRSVQGERKMEEKIENRIIKFIEDSEDYPTNQELTDEFAEDETFLVALDRLENRTIFYDSKHDAWMVLTPFQPGKYVRLK